MTTSLSVHKTTGLAKTTAVVRQLDKRLERARQRFNERVARAEADFVDDMRRAVAEVSAEASTPETPANPEMPSGEAAASASI